MENLKNLEKVSRNRPTYTKGYEFLGLKVKGYTELTIARYYFVKYDGDEDNIYVYHDGKLIDGEPQLETRCFEPEFGDYDDKVSDHDRETMDFTACSLDDCGYCGKCMY